MLKKCGDHVNVIISNHGNSQMQRYHQLVSATQFASGENWYMCPELADRTTAVQMNEGNDYIPITKETEVWSLGALLVEMVYLEKPGASTACFSKQPKVVEDAKERCARE